MARRSPAKPSLTQQCPPPDFLLDVVARLLQRYVPVLPAPRRFPEPLSGVVRVLLAQQNTRWVAQRQWEALQATYPQWEAALLDGPDGLETTLRRAGGGLTRMKAGYIYGVLAALEEAHGRLSLEFLRDLPDAEARAALEALPGVGQKTASLVLLFDLIRPAMPVDGHIERWAKRLELVPEKWNVNRVEKWFDEALPRDWELRYGLHLSGVNHGRETCKSQRPLCAECVLLELCPSAGIVLSGDRE
ncbi:endonuclease III [Deinococcus sp.]|uniref:endonuclease III domain-containing protein n=1 Tax=Deinococcus sp. TaxID=47478 RepID=UPI0025BF31F5|nr:endonuclease III [Deinococcus sp.]